MNQMEIFKNPEFGSIRTFEQDGKVLFCGKDIAKALGYQRTADAITAHCKGVCVLPTPSNGGIQRMKFIPEGDVYRLIVHSKLPTAERFERWVFDEVLPSIRKHGAYITREKLWEIATSPEALMKLCSDLLAEREKNAALREENAMLEGKAAFYDLFIDLKHSTNLRTTAKELIVPERRFVRFLLERTALCKARQRRPVHRQGLLQPRAYRLLYAGNAPGQAVFCPAAGQYPADDMMTRYLLRRLVVPP